MAGPVVHVLNGPNINMTGLRDPDHYGSANYRAMCADIEAVGKKLGLSAEIRQTNSEGELVGWLQEIARAPAPLVINAGGYTHTSIAVRDAVELVQSPKVEVHMSNIHAREDFRHSSFLSAVVDGVIVGFGGQSYALALVWIAEHVKR